MDPPLKPGPFSQDQQDDDDDDDGALGIFLPTFVIMVLWHKKGENRLMIANKGI